MIRFILRATALLIIISILLYLSSILLALVKVTPFLTRHHSINLAYIGTFLGVASLGYMLKKYQWVSWGKIRWWLDAHVVVGALGLLMVLLHSWYQFKALLPSLNTFFMVLIGISGFFGWHLYLTTVKTLMVEIKSLEEAEQYVLAKMASTAFRFWRFIHVQTSLAALFFTLVHVLSLLVFRGRY